MERDRQIPLSPQERARNHILFLRALMTTARIHRRPEDFDPSLVRESEKWIKRNHIPTTIYEDLNDQEFELLEMRWECQVEIERLKFNGNGKTTI